MSDYFNGTIIYLQKTPFAGTDANSDLGKFYRDCQAAPTLQVFDEEQPLRETLEQIGPQIDMFETNMKDFDDFVQFNIAR